MNNEAIAVKCSLHDPQTHATHAYIPIIVVRRKEVGVYITSHVQLITNALRPVKVKNQKKALERFHEHERSVIRKLF